MEFSLCLVFFVVGFKMNCTLNGFFFFFFVYGIELLLQENVPIEEVFLTLRCNKDGLTTVAAQERLAIFGYNKLEEKKVLFFVYIFFFCLFVCK